MEGLKLNLRNVNKSNKYTKRERVEHIQGYVFLTPAIIITSIFIGLSVLFVIYLSFNKVNLFNGTYTWVGFKNYIRVFKDETAMVAFKNTLTFSAFVVPLQTLLALILASVLNSKIKGKLIFRTIYFLPTLTSSSALTMIFMFMFSITGPINKFLIEAGVLETGINFLQEPNFSLKVIMAMNIWSTIPFYMTLYLASLQELPESLYEAANIDGAGPIRRFISITVPYLKPITTYVLLTSIIGTLQMFDQAYIFSNGSGGPENSTLTVALMIYKYAFGTQNAMGYATTLAIILAILIMIVSMLAQKFNKEEAIY